MPAEYRKREVSESYAVYNCDRCAAEIADYGLRNDGDITPDSLRRAFGPLVPVALVSAHHRPGSGGTTDLTILICEACFKSLEAWLVDRPDV